MNRFATKYLILRFKYAMHSSPDSHKVFLLVQELLLRDFTMTQMPLGPFSRVLHNVKNSRLRAFCKVAAWYQSDIPNSQN